MTELFNFIMRTGLVAKIVLLTLFLLSIVSWTIILEKLRLLNRIKKQSRQFNQKFRTHSGWGNLFRESRELHFCPFTRVFRRFFNSVTKSQQPGARENATPQFHHPAILDRMAASLKSSMDIIIAELLDGYEKRLIFLATTVSVSPFLGLFGTVWGIMTAFMSMGTEGTADITAVGPGIAEALITTVAGLAVAIPTVVAYNYFIDKFKRLENELDNFAAELVVQIQQQQEYPR